MRHTYDAYDVLMNKNANISINDTTRLPIVVSMKNAAAG